MNLTTGTTGARQHSTFEDSVARRGRATRPQFWWSALVVTIASVPVIALTSPADGRLIEVSLGASSAVGYVSFPLIWVLVLLVPAVTITVRRLNDAGRGERELLWMLLPIVGWSVLILRLCEPTERAGGVAAFVSPAASSEPIEDGAPENPLKEWTY